MKIYIDFDGVIMDTARVIKELVDKSGLDLTSDEAFRDYITGIGFKYIIEHSNHLNDSMKHINDLMKNESLDIKILTHVLNIEEAEEKINFIRKYNKDVDIIIVPKNVDKSIAINPRGAILIDDYTENLRRWKASGGIGVRFSLKRNGKGLFFAISSLDQINEFLSNNCEFCPEGL